MFPETAVHGARPAAGAGGRALAGAFVVLLLAACVAQPPVPAPPPAPPVPGAAAPAASAATVPPAAAASAPPAPQAPAAPPALEGAPVVTSVPVIVAPFETRPVMGSPVDALLAYADRLRSLSPADLTQEINSQADAGEAAPRQLRLAMALLASRNPSNSIRAQVLLQRVLAQTSPQAQALHPLARLLAAQNTETRRQDEQTERLNQQLREAQRRIEQLNDRLEAVRAIERSLRPAPLPGPVPTPAPAAPAGSARP